MRPWRRFDAIYDHGLALAAFRGLNVATRPDCIDEEKADLLASYERARTSRSGWSWGCSPPAMQRFGGSGAVTRPRISCATFEMLQAAAA